MSRSNLTKYCACHAERLAYLVLITYESSFTMRGATGVTIQPHQILRLPRRNDSTYLIIITYETSFTMRGATGVTIQPHQIPRLPRQNDSTCLIVVTYETSFPMRGATGITIQPHQILRLPRKMTLQDFKENLQKQVKRHFQCGADPTMIRA